MLTRKQKDLLLCIHGRMAKGDIAPSFDEMREALGLKSKSGIHRLITALVERGYLERLRHRARALEVRRLPEGTENANTPLPRKAKGNASAPIEAAYAALSSIPFYGRIAAGTPIAAIRDEGRSVDVPPFLLGRGDHYALEISGDSMSGMGIQDGDTVIIKKSDTADDGTVVVALVDGEEVTLKRLKREKGKIILIPENEQYKPQKFDPARVRIQGKLVGLLRSYH